jgi:hypothetical protein
MALSFQHESKTSFFILELHWFLSIFPKRTSSVLHVEEFIKDSAIALLINAFFGMIN